MREQEGREVVIVEAVRTPVGRGHREKGYYKDTHPAELLGKTYSEVLSRAVLLEHGRELPREEPVQELRLHRQLVDGH